MVLFHRPGNLVLTKRKVPVQRSTLQRKLPAARKHGNLNRQLRSQHAHQQRSRLEQPQGVAEDTGARFQNLD